MIMLTCGCSLLHACGQQPVIPASGDGAPRQVAFSEAAMLPPPQAEAVPPIEEVEPPAPEPQAAMEITDPPPPAEAPVVSLPARPIVDRRGPQETRCDGDAPWIVVYQTDFATWNEGIPEGWLGSAAQGTLLQASEGYQDAVSVELRPAQPDWAVLVKMTSEDGAVLPGHCHRFTVHTRGGHPGELVVRYSYRKDGQLVEKDVPAAGGDAWTPVVFALRMPEDMEPAGAQLRIFRKPMSQETVLVDQVVIERAGG